MNNKFSSKKKTFSSESTGTWTLTEPNTNGLIGQMIMNDRPFPVGFSNNLLYPGEKRRPLKDWWSRVRVVWWYFIHLKELFRELSNLYERTSDKTGLGDQIIKEVFSRYCYLVHLTNAVHSVGLQINWPPEWRREMDVIGSSSSLGFQVRCYHAPTSDYIRHLINAGTLPEIQDEDEETEVTHIQVIVINDKGESFTLGILKKDN